MFTKANKTLQKLKKAEPFENRPNKFTSFHFFQKNSVIEVIIPKNVWRRLLHKGSLDNKHQL